MKSEKRLVALAPIDNGGLPRVWGLHCKRGNPNLPQPLRDGACRSPESQDQQRKQEVRARGFNDRYSNKLLVLIDGRSVFNPLFNGVFWDTIDTLMEDIDRIEVIRGPGGTLWETKAVNGVINIITRDARDTVGSLVVAGGGTEHKALAGVRHGAELSNGVHLRLWAKHDRLDDSAFEDGSSANDDFHATRGGFRMDWEPADRQKITVTGDLFSGANDDLVPVGDLTLPELQRLEHDGDDFEGGHLLGRWEWEPSEAEALSAQVYVDHYNRKNPLLEQTIDTLDFELNHRRALGERNQFSWGLGYRYIDDDTDALANIAFDPQHFDYRAYSAYLQDEFSLIPEHLILTAGVKAERNPFTHWEFQPTARVLWKPTEAHTLWGAVTRSVRTPSRVEDALDAAFPGPGATVFIKALPNRDLDSEKVLSYELGYRTQPTPKLNLDLDPSISGASTGSGDSSPRNRANLQSSFVLGERWELDAILRYVDEVKAPSISSYTEGDLQLSFQATEDLSLSLVGRNLFHSQHSEFRKGPLDPYQFEIERSVFAKLQWEF